MSHVKPDQTAPNAYKSIPYFTIWASMRKTPLLQAKNKGADQPASPHSLISVFVICFLEGIIAERASYKFLIQYSS